MQINSLGISRNTWEWVKTPVGIFGNFWEFLGIPNNFKFEGELSLEFVGIFENLWEFIGICKNPQN